MIICLWAAGVVYPFDRRPLATKISGGKKS